MARRPTQPKSAAVPTSPPLRWLLFLHQLPAGSSNLRVRTWRRLQQLGAVPVKQAMYVLPDTAGAREDFEWLKAEIEGAGGQASVFAASGVDAWSNDALVGEFRRSREAAYEAIARDARKLLPRAAGRRGASIRRQLQQFKERLAAVERIDFFGSPGRDAATGLVRQVEEAGRATPPRGTTSARIAGTAGFKGRLWVTRPRPGIDRLASAWLIRRFIDAQARFGFTADRDSAPPDALPFDMFGVEFGHRGSNCTFETLCEVFGISDTAAAAIARIVHDLDLKDGRFGVSEAPAIGLLVDGLQRTHAADDVLLEGGIALFEALYQALQAQTRPRPRPAASEARRRTRRW